MDLVAITGWFVLLAVTSVVVAFFWRDRRHAIPSVLAAASALGLFSGLITTGLALGHLVGVVVVEIRRSPIRYDFRVYALLLLGVMLVVLGTRLVAASRGMARGEGSAWERAVQTTLVLLAINAPLAPIQGFAVALCVFGSGCLVALVAARGRIARLPSHVGADGRPMSS